MIDVEEMKRWKRQLKAMLDTAGRDDPEGFAQVVEMLDDAHSNGLARAAQQLRTPKTEGDMIVPGHSWADLARPLDITRQGAQQRFGRATS